MPTRKPSAAAASSPAKRPAHRPAHEPTKVDRDTVKVMVAGGIIQADIARSKGISLPTLRKHYRAELDNGKTELDTMVVVEHVKLIKKGDFAAIKWWQQSRMGWRGDNGDDDGRERPERTMRVTIELVGEPAPSTLDHAPLPREDRKPALNGVRRNVRFVG
jgi:hypothetical protein